jgi:hypothetical protein
MKNILFLETPLHKRKFKYQSWYLTPYCGLEVQKPNQGLQSVKSPDNTFTHWNACVGSAPQTHSRVSNINFDIWFFFGGGSLLISYEKYIKDGKFLVHLGFQSTKENSNIKVDIWHPTVGLRCRNPTRDFSQLKARTIPLMEIPSGQEICCL